jgi:hypothetical protein
MSKKRSDSLFAQLKPQQRDMVFFWLVEEQKSLAAVQGLISEQFSLKCSLSSVSRLLSTHGLVWRIDRAKEKAAISEKSLPKDVDAVTRRGLAQREFELSFTNLSVKELAALKRIKVQERRTDLMERKLTLDEARERSAAGVKEAGKRLELTPDVIKQILSAVDARIMGES